MLRHFVDGGVALLHRVQGVIPEDHIQIPVVDMLLGHGQGALGHLRHTIRRGRTGICQYLRRLF